MIRVLESSYAVATVLAAILVASCTLEATGEGGSLAGGGSSGNGGSSGKGGVGGLAGFAEGGTAGTVFQGGAAGIAGQSIEDAGDAQADSGFGGSAGSFPDGSAGDSGDSNAQEACVVAEELCDNQDNDCDGFVDEDNPGGGLECTTKSPGVCAPGTTQCSAGILECQSNVAAAAEKCDGLDNNCDGQTDENDPEGNQACTLSGVGVCAVGTTHCVQGKVLCQQSVPATSEICDDVDNDCSGKSDEGCPQSLNLGDVPKSLTPLHGNPNGGSEFSETCPQGTVLVGFSGLHGNNIDQITGICGTVGVVQDTSIPFSYSVSIGPPLFTLPTHGQFHTTPFSVTCPQDTVITGIFGHVKNGDGGGLHSLGLVCSTITLEGSIGAYSAALGMKVNEPEVGAQNDTEFDDDCPSGTVARTLAGRSGGYIDAFRIGCHTFQLTLVQ